MLLFLDGIITLLVNDVQSFSLTLITRGSTCVIELTLYLQF